MEILKILFVRYRFESEKINRLPNLVLFFWFFPLSRGVPESSGTIPFIISFLSQSALRVLNF
jgi:hypothetical protein